MAIYYQDPFYRFYPKEFPTNAPIKPYQIKPHVPKGRGKLATIAGTAYWVWKNRKWIFHNTGIVGAGAGLTYESTNPLDETLRTIPDRPNNYGNKTSNYFGKRRGKYSGNLKYRSKRRCSCKECIHRVMASKQCKPRRKYRYSM